ncbi:serine protease family S33 [Achlya hypogyna]|uniref:Serine protease family S33 n=1 Tax=Achlya hypogyna TaxID=1202772 RepID=A0A1V9YZM0_ACHHY|nr:serine protease family S33 [Achlya hypogyna]
MRLLDALSAVLRPTESNDIGVPATLLVLLWLAIFAHVAVRLGLIGLYKLHYWCTARVPALTYQGNDIMLQIVRDCSLLRAPYHPTWYLFNGHLQTAMVAVEDAEPHVSYRRELFELSDGGVLSLDWVQTSSVTTNNEHNKPTILILHGLAGGSHEKYVRAGVVELVNHGWRVVVMNARGCGKTKLVTPKLFCAAYTQDVREVTAYLRKTHIPTSVLLGVGYSLGANILTKFVGEDGPTCQLTAAVAVGNPFCLTTASHHLMGSWLYRRTYNNIMTKNLIDVVFRQTNACEVFEDHPVVDLEHLRTATNLREYDDRFTRLVFGFDTVSDFYRQASSVHYIKHIAIPTLFVSAHDDPICVHQGIPYDDCAANPNVLLAVTHAGGHLGFYEGPARLPWSPAVVAEYCNAIYRLVAAGSLPAVVPAKAEDPATDDDMEVCSTASSSSATDDEAVVVRELPKRELSDPKLLDELTDAVTATLDDALDAVVEHATVDNLLVAGVATVAMYLFWRRK